MAVMRVRPVLPDSHEALFRAYAPACSLTDLRPAVAPELRTALAQPRLERAIGVIYRPATERRSHYFEAVLPEQFDAFVWFAETQALTPLPGPGEEGGDVAETFPFSL
jgi:erythromycin esterase-like protein